MPLAPGVKKNMKNQTIIGIPESAPWSGPRAGFVVWLDLVNLMDLVDLLDLVDAMDLVGVVAAAPVVDLVELAWNVDLVVLGHLAIPVYCHHFH